MKVDMRNLLVSTEFEHCDSRDHNEINSGIAKAITRAFKTLKSDEDEVAIVVIKRRIRSSKKMEDWLTLIVSPNLYILHKRLVPILNRATKELTYMGGPHCGDMPPTVDVRHVSPKRLKIILEAG